MKKLHVIKIGGNILDDPEKLEKFLADFSDLDEIKILVHGGGKLATALAEKLGIQQTLVDGRRVTDAKTLDITLMVYAGLINKSLVAKLQARQCNAMGFCGADGNLIQSTKRTHTTLDFGYVGDIPNQGVQVKLFRQLLEIGIIPVISPITHDGRGQLLNTNADTMAAEIAIALAPSFDVTLSFCFEKQGVLTDIENENSFTPVLDKNLYQQLRAMGVISKGMIPKLDNAFGAFEKGVKYVNICHAENIAGTSSQLKGTQLAAT